MDKLLLNGVGTLGSVDSTYIVGLISFIIIGVSLLIILYRIVRFNASKKDRRIHWMDFSPALLGPEKAQKSGYVNFIAHKYGEQSYTLTFPEKEMIPGEYGIFLSAVNGTTIPIGTFSIPK